MLYLKEALVYLAMLVAVTSSQATYNSRRSQYLPPKRTYNPVKENVKPYKPVKEVVKTYNPVKKGLGKPIHPKGNGKLPVGGPLGGIHPAERPVDGGFFPDSLLGGIENIGGGPVMRNGRPRLPPIDVNPGGMIPSGIDSRRGSDPWVDGGIRSNRFPSSIGGTGLTDGSSWIDRNGPFDPSLGRDASLLPGIDVPRSTFPRNRARGGPLGRQSPLADIIGQSGLRGRDPRDPTLGGFLEGGVDGIMGDIGPNGRPGLPNRSPVLTRNLRERLRERVSGADINRGIRGRNIPRLGRLGRGLRTPREPSNW